ncbi:hypothetical protein TanjilG_09883 [Lupinus angustifolius]|uniref:AT hook motif-containing protein n=1 Tax=Lupinus angustifolius TaxID=3871 RepID=A0A1J7GCV4_LUPAN|nr:PREDICTED: uncharacterized protein LOC109326223 isoform X2 [Lupinus angustifolius]OIV98231.1 hypothetical protein TanjilG_09883 [Lupinus angustifolius]
MDQQNPNITPDGLGDVPSKRKRGRPRKYPRPDSEDSSHMLFGQSKKPNPGSSEQTKLLPGYEGVNGNQQSQRGQENGSNDAMVGQEVSGVIEAVFDAGYLLNVRVGDSDTTLRGLIFKPGRYVPISPENDVAPGVPMIQRNEVPFPSGTSQVQSPLPNDRNEHHVNVHRNDSKSGEKMLVKDHSSGLEDKANDIAHPVLIKPLQGVLSHPHENSAPAPTMSDYTKTGKMTELLQDSSIEIQASKAAAKLGSGNKLDDARNLGTEHKELFNNQLKLSEHSIPDS